jgi:hypothetical protein
MDKRIDENTVFTTLRIEVGNEVQVIGGKFRLTRCVGDLGYAGAMVVQSAEGSIYPLSRVVELR